MSKPQPCTSSTASPAHNAIMISPTRILRASWSSTLRLPKTNFPPRPLPASNIDCLRQCTDDFYQWQQSSERVLHEAHRKKPLDQVGEGAQKAALAPNIKKATELFTLHDGPPYANGPLHIGHALNKITKDIICRFEVSQGKRVSYVPGWDCHGLPIEIKALQAQKKDVRALNDPVGVREAACELATQTVEDQKRGFKEWSVMGDWDNAYKTMDREFEIRQLGIFKNMFEKDLIYRQNKPVYWSPSSRTALAEAELEYDENHQSLAAIVRFPLRVDEAFRKEKLRGARGEICAAIWTTTPWTLPANKAIAVHKDLEYCLVEDLYSNKTVLAVSRLDEYEKFAQLASTYILSGILGSELLGQVDYLNPFQKAHGFQPVVHADFVTDSSGTGLVHLAPGHGMDDYLVCSALNIPAFAPVDDSGAFTKEAFPEQPTLLEGLSVADRSGSLAVCDYLEESGMFYAKHNYRHKYPVDWRTKKPVIVRATEQWFANIEGIKDVSMEAIANVNFMPETGRSRLESFVQGRSQWCISRQRAWGVPIPALYKVDGDTLTAHMDSETIQHIIDVIKERGINAWWTDAQDNPAWKPKHLTGTYVRGKDTMDVWFDSGTSWTLLPPQQDRPVADVYFEGTDQHRGWFQSSLLTHVASQMNSTAKAIAPYRTLITHGFVLDSEGRKMSKSLGNVISPSQIMSGELLPPVKRKKQTGNDTQAKKVSYDAMGPDALRLWVAGSDYMRDVTVGQPVLHSVNQSLHKYRVTFKWLLGIFSLPTCPPPFSSFNDLNTGGVEQPKFQELTDCLAMHRLVQVSKEVHGYYAKYEFFKGVHTINKYISNDLSAFYFETLKDRIYTGEKADCETLQRALGLVFYQLLQMLAPICPLLVEEVWTYVPEGLKHESIHPARALRQPLDEPTYINKSHFDTMNQTLSALGSTIKAAQEHLRADKTIGSGLETGVTLYLSPASATRLLAEYSSCLDSESRQAQAMESQFAGLFVVSGFNVRVYAGSENDDKTGFTREDAEEIKGSWRWFKEGVVDAAALSSHQTKTLEDATVFVHPPAHDKCPRCWRFVRKTKAELCARCESVVQAEWREEV